MSYKVLIVDDEALAREAISLRLEPYDNFIICGESDNGLDAIVLAEALQPDIIFLDIEMPELDGISAARRIAKNHDILIVFVTAYAHFALSAFRVNAIDYLLKPVDDEHFSDLIEKLLRSLKYKNAAIQNQQLLKTIEQFRESHTEKNTENPDPEFLQKIAVVDQGETRMLCIEQIESIVSVKDYLCITVENETFVHRSTVKGIQALLNPEKFFRCHRSHIVNRDHVDKLTRENAQYFIVLSSSERHPVSRRFLKNVKTELKRQQ